MEVYPARRRMFVVFFVPALVFRLAIAVVLRSGNTRTEMELIALNVVDFGEYKLYGVATAHCTPVFPLYLAGLFGIFGTGLLVQIVKVTLTCAVSALRCGLVPLFTIDAGLESGIAALAGSLNVLYVGALETEISGGLDGPFVAIALLILVWAVVRIWRGGRVFAGRRGGLP